MGKNKSIENMLREFRVEQTYQHWSLDRLIIAGLLFFFFFFLEPSYLKKSNTQIEIDY